MEILHFYLCFFPSLCRVLTRKRNICRRHFSVFPARSNCHFSVNKRASWTRSHHRYAGQTMSSMKVDNESWQWKLTGIGISVFDCRWTGRSWNWSLVGKKEEKEKKMEKSSFWSGGRRSQTMRWRIRLAEIGKNCCWGLSWARNAVLVFGTWECRLMLTWYILSLRNVNKTLMWDTSHICGMSKNSEDLLGFWCLCK